MFGNTAPTPYDLKFRLLDVPVRVNPFFWGMAAILGWRYRTPLQILIWMACVFVSILVHEFGHALSARQMFRSRPSVLLYYMGGLCFSDDDHRALWKRAYVLIMGPVAGFLLMGLVLFLGMLILGFPPGLWPFAMIPDREPASWFGHLPDTLNHSIQSAYFDLTYINAMWGLFNLLPIYPLDGGQLAGVFFSMRDRRKGPMYGHLLGMLVAGGIALYLFQSGDGFTALFVASLAFLNYQMFQATRYETNSLSRFERDDDWWKR